MMRMMMIHPDDGGFSVCCLERPDGVGCEEEGIVGPQWHFSPRTYRSPQIFSVGVARQQSRGNSGRLRDGREWRRTTRGHVEGRTPAPTAFSGVVIGHCHCHWRVCFPRWSLGGGGGKKGKVKKLEPREGGEGHGRKWKREEKRKENGNMSTSLAEDASPQHA
jgi:hypothetical protein